jgi:3-oxoacyl-[acyl-carrier protein] reductase
VLCISSICGVQALGCPLGYAAAKAALNSFVQNAARPLAKHGIRVNALAPGNIIFPGSVWEEKSKHSPQAVAEMLQREVALNRLGQAEEVADFAAFLVSPRANFATGAVFVLDGGQIR